LVQSRAGIELTADSCVLLPLQDEGCALCLTPQGYHNVRPDGDIFNNVNLGFWEYILPGEAWA
jgi:hypothetical protein